MSISNPPQYRYSLFDVWDKEAFKQIKGIGKAKNFPEIMGTDVDVNQFLITLIRTQKSLHDWRDLLIDNLKQVKDTNIIDTKSLNVKYPSSSISFDEPEWVTYEEDRVVSKFIDELATKPVQFIGSKKEISEFIMRFILGQLGHDWEWTIMMIWEMLGESSDINVKDLNNEMRHFDYLNIFE